MQGPKNRRADGANGETIAVDYLEKKGYRIVARNFRYERSEIDIIADDRDVLVFIEVKARRSRQYGEPEESVTSYKQRRLRRVARGYLFLKDIDDRECRFDVVAIRQTGDDVDIRHYENAF